MRRAEANNGGMPIFDLNPAPVPSGPTTLRLAALPRAVALPDGGGALEIVVTNVGKFPAEQVVLRAIAGDATSPAVLLSGVGWRGTGSNHVTLTLPGLDPGDGVRVALGIDRVRLFLGAAAVPLRVTAQADNSRPDETHTLVYVRATYAPAPPTPTGTLG